MSNVKSQKKYQIILADPPWSFRGYDLKKEARYVGNKYKVQSKEWLMRLPIENISDTDCALFIWVTAPKLNEVFSVISSWGFEYKTRAFTWVKKNKKSNTLFWGMGRWTRANTEDCLLATRGKPKRINAGIHSVIETPIREHSRKPDEARQRIVKLMGDLPRIELFAREKVEGWTSMGYDIDGMDIKESLDKLITQSKKELR